MFAINLFRKALNDGSPREGKGMTGTTPLMVLWVKGEEVCGKVAMFCSAAWQWDTGFSPFCNRHCLQCKRVARIEIRTKNPQYAACGNKMQPDGSKGVVQIAKESPIRNALLSAASTPASGLPGIFPSLSRRHAEVSWAPALATLPPPKAFKPCRDLALPIP